MKKMIPLIAFIVSIGVILLLAKDAIAKFAIEKGVTTVTGLNLTMDKFNLGLSKQLVRIEGLELENPKGFEEKNMVDLPEVFLQVDIPSVFKGKVHVRELRLNLAEFAVIKNKEGILNLNTLTALGGEGKAKPTKEKELKKEVKPMAIQIDKLSLKIDKVTYRDHSSVIGKATSKTFNINLNESFENITDLNVLVKLIVSKVLKSTTIGQLANIDMKQFADVSALANSGKQLIGDASAQAEELLKQAKKQVNTEAVKKLSAEKLEASKEAAAEALSGAGDSMKGAADNLSDAAGDLFGSLKSKAQKATS